MWHVTWCQTSPAAVISRTLFVAPQDFWSFQTTSVGGLWFPPPSEAQIWKSPKQKGYVKATQSRCMIIHRVSQAKLPKWDISIVGFCKSRIRSKLYMPHLPNMYHYYKRKQILSKSQHIDQETERLVLLLQLAKKPENALRHDKCEATETFVQKIRTFSSWSPVFMWSSCSMYVFSDPNQLFSMLKPKQLQHKTIWNFNMRWSFKPWQHL